MHATGLSQTEALEESLKMTLAAYTRKPNAVTEQTFQATDKDENLTRFTHIEEMLKKLKSSK